MTFVSTKQRRCVMAKLNPSRGTRRIRGTPSWNTFRTSNLRGHIQKEIVISAGSAIFPHIIPIYQAYNVVKTGKELYDACIKPNNKEVFEKVIIYGISRISEERSSQIAKEIVYAPNSKGIIRNIAERTKVDERIYRSMLEESIKNGITSGIKDLTSYAVETIVE